MVCNDKQLGPSYLLFTNGGMTRTKGTTLTLSTRSTQGIPACTTGVGIHVSGALVIMLGQLQLSVISKPTF